MEKEIKVSVIIPTYNGEEYLQEVLKAIFEQRVDFSYEVIAIDSGSKDKTLDIILKFPVKLIKIPNSEFGHGKTRNFGAEQASGKYLVYITQDATPSNKNWLREIIKGFDVADNVANVLGKQIPRENCNPTTKRNIEETFRMIGNGKDELAIYYIKKGREGKKEYKEKKDVMRFNSDVCAAYAKKTWEKVKFREVEYAEDQLMGQDLLEAGYKRVYSPEAAVFHSHNYPVKDFLKRFFDEYRALNNIFGFVDKNVTPLRIIPSTFYGWYYDSKYILKQKEYNLREKAHWSLNSFFMNFFRRLGAYLGGRCDKLPSWLKRTLSLEQSKKSK